MSVKKVTFLGLGVMGYPMAGHLKKAGYDVVAYNRTKQKAVAWQEEFGGDIEEDVCAAVEGADVVFMCVGNDNDVQDVASKAISAMPENAILVDHTTASAELARALHEQCSARCLGFLDAPVSGGQAGAEKGELTIMVGGDEPTFEKVKSVMDAYARHSQRLGDAGSGQLAKMMNQICIAGIVQGLSEALHFGQKAGLDCTAVVDVISKGAAQSWQMDNRAATMLAGKYDYGFAVDWMRKDLAIALDEARKNGATLSLAALVDQYYADVQKSGGGRWDTSSLLTRLH